ncbi:hypothetical protein [Actinacidiphila yanglinensis]|uniref:hypothetical protein n=1 Tax=Actinacidiphila yanglinensis TaxID=310779 RepID=UPI000CDEAAD1|nr:hypothetical protein [Actinacidiphila yanglinensis]
MPADVTVRTDPAHGGRWTSLRTGAREWLWHRDEPRRPGVVPGDAFADAGGLEECVPTVRGTPDHGAAWTRRWTDDGDGTHTVHCPGFALTRRIRHQPGRAVADYRLTAAPGLRFLWAAHALLDVSPAARLDLPPATPARFYADGGAAWTPFAWPRAAGAGGGAPARTGPAADDPGPAADDLGADRAGSPNVPGGASARDIPFDRLGPDDGTAAGAIALTPGAAVHDGADTLRFALEADDGQPVSVAVWRNLRGFPEDAPYRSIGVEPMLGRVFDLAAAGEGDAAVVPAGGEVRWRLTVTAV